MSTDQATSGPPESNPAEQTPAAPADDTKLDRRLLAVAGVAVLGALMSILDITVVNVAIPTLVEEFDTKLATIQWVATGYTLALASVIPLSAWGASRIGTKKLYMISLVLFTIGSVLAGLSWSVESLIGFRVLQGLGGGMLMPTIFTILTRAAGPQRIGRMMSVIGIPMLLGPVLGPVLGGWLVQDFSWRLIFFINLPIGLLAIFLAWRVLDNDGPATAHKLDWLGLGLLSPSLALIIYGLAESTDGGFERAQSFGPIAVGLVLFVAFLWHAGRSSNPLIDLRLFSNKTFASTSAALVLMIIAVFGGMLLLPLYLFQVRGESAIDTGLLLVPQGLGAMIAMPLAGQLVDRTGIGRIVPFGLLAIAGSFLALTQLTSETSYWYFGAFLFLMGLGMGFTMMPIMSGALQTLRKRDIPNASTTINILQQVSASIGTAVLSVILSNAIADKMAPLLAQGNQPPPAGLTPQQLEAAKAAAAAEGNKLAAEAFGQTFWWALGLVVIAFVVAVVLLPKSKPEPVEDDEDAQTAEPALMMG